MKGLVSLSDKFDGFVVLPEPKEPTTPPPMKEKVVSVPTRVPINRQAALIIARPPWWAKLEYDVKDAPAPTINPEVLKAAHQQNAALVRKLERLRESYDRVIQENESLRRQLADERELRAKLQKALL